MSNTTTISLNDAKRLEKRLGAWVWDGLLYERDSITNPMLRIMPNESGKRIRRFLSEMPAFNAAQFDADLAEQDE